MSTVIYPSPIYGPVHSRRLGLSLGVNLMPADGKICTFDCLYCECGFNKDRRTHLPHPTRQQVAEALEKQLIKMHNDQEHPDVLTFAGNGEPTSHPEFPGIIDDTIRLRDKWCPKAKISVLSNATFSGHDDIRQALLKVDNNILKLDTVSMEYIRKVDRPIQPSYDVKDIINLNPLLFLSSCCGTLAPYLSLCHCSLNQSAIGFLFIVRFSLLSSSGSFSTLKISSFISKFRLCCSE